MWIFTISSQVKLCLVCSLFLTASKPELNLFFFHLSTHVSRRASAYKRRFGIIEIKPYWLEKFHWFLTWMRIACHSGFRNEYKLNFAINLGCYPGRWSALHPFFPSVRCFNSPFIGVAWGFATYVKNDNERTSWQIGSDCGENGKEEGSEMRKYRFSQGAKRRKLLRYSWKSLVLHCAD